MVNYQFNGWRFKHVGNNMFVVNDKDTIRISYKDRNPFIVHINTPSQLIPKDIEEAFVNKIKEDFPCGFPSA